MKKEEGRGKIERVIGMGIWGFGDGNGRIRRRMKGLFICMRVEGKEREKRNTFEMFCEEEAKLRKEENPIRRF